MSTDNNHFVKRKPVSAMPDPYGHASLILVESLIHGLIERRIIDTGDAIEIVDNADEVQVDFAEAANGHEAPMWKAHALLTAIARSLRHDEVKPGVPSHP